MQLFDFTSLLQLTISWMYFYFNDTNMVGKGTIRLHIGLVFPSNLEDDITQYNLDPYVALQLSETDRKGWRA